MKKVQKTNLDSLLDRVQMSQHSVRIIKATLEDYPSLQDELRKLIDQKGVTKVAVGMRKGDKPKVMMGVHNIAMLYLNDK